MNSSFLLSKASLKRSMSSLDFNVNHGSLVAVAEIEDEELALPFEPLELQTLNSSKVNIKKLITKSVMASGFIRGVKKSIVFNEEATDEIRGIV